MPTIRVLDIIDIFIVTVLIYQLLLLIRGTRAVQLVTGVVILILAYAISRAVGLYTLQFVLQYLGVVIPIALLVIFQPELRRMLELLISLFFPNSPLHDGAAILRGNRVVAAGCLLPLSENPVVARTLGTRHRAGLGIAEQTDAVAIIVSEETGTVTLAREGELIRGMSEEELKAALLELFAADTPAPASWWWRTFRRA